MTAAALVVLALVVAYLLRRERALSAKVGGIEFVLIDVLGELGARDARAKLRRAAPCRSSASGIHMRRADGVCLFCGEDRP